MTSVSKHTAKLFPLTEHWQAIILHVVIITLNYASGISYSRRQHVH